MRAIKLDMKLNKRITVQIENRHCTVMHFGGLFQKLLIINLVQKISDWKFKPKILHLSNLESLTTLQYPQYKPRQAHLHIKITKGQLISKCLIGAFNFFQKTNENKSTWGIIVVKSNSFVRFLEEFTAWQFAFEFYWPLDFK